VSELGCLVSLGRSRASGVGDGWEGPTRCVARDGGGFGAGEAWGHESRARGGGGGGKRQVGGCPARAGADSAARRVGRVDVTRSRLRGRRGAAGRAAVPSVGVVERRDGGPFDVREGGCRLVTAPLDGNMLDRGWAARRSGGSVRDCGVADQGIDSAAAGDAQCSQKPRAGVDTLGVVVGSPLRATSSRGHEWVGMWPARGGRKHLAHAPSPTIQTARRHQMEHV